MRKLPVSVTASSPLTVAYPDGSTHHGIGLVGVPYPVGAGYVAIDEQGQPPLVLPAATTLNAAPVVGAAVRAYATTGGSIAASTLVGVPLDVTDFNTDPTVYTVAQSGITVRASGIYIVSFAASLTAASNSRVSVHIPNISSDAVQGPVSDTTQVGSSSVVRIAAGAVLQPQIYLTAPGTFSGTTTGDSFLALARLA